MLTDTSFVLLATATFILTYLFHSTIALMVAWIRVAWARREHHRLVERWWKVAAMLPLVTAALQTSLGGYERAYFDRSLKSWISDTRAVDDVESTNEPASHVSEDGASLGNDRAVQRRHRGSSGSAGEDDYRWQWSVESNSPTVAAVRIAPTDHGILQRSLLNRCFTFARNPRLPDKAARVIAGVGLCIVAVGFTRFILQSVGLWRRLARLPELKHGRARQLLDDLLIHAGVRYHVCLRQADESTLPFAHGLYRWTITLPRRIEKKLDAEQLKALLAHELAHLVRRDTGWLHAGRLLATCFGFQPLNHLARSQWRRAAEYCCDDWAIRQSIHPISLAHCLTSVAQHRMRPWSQASLGMADDSSLLSDRVERLLGESCRRPRCCSVARSLLTFTTTIVAGVWLILLCPTVTVSSTQSVAAVFSDVSVDPESEIELLSASLEELDQEMKKLDSLLASSTTLAGDGPLHRQLAVTYEKIRRRQRRILSRRDQLAGQTDTARQPRVSFSVTDHVKPDGKESME